MTGRDSRVALAWARFLDRTPMLGPTVAFIAGILSAPVLYFPNSGWLWILLALISAAIAASGRLPVSRLVLFLFAGAAVRSFSIGAAVAVPSDYTGEAGACEVEQIAVGESAVTATIRLTSGDYRGARLLVISGADILPDLYPGDHLIVGTEITPAVTHRDVEEEIVPYERYDGVISGVAYVSDPGDITVVSRSAGLRAILARERMRVALMIDRSSLDAHTKDLLKALLTGDSGAVMMPDRSLFAAAGVAHLLAVSGMHVGMIAMLAGIALWPLIVWGLRRSHVIAVIGIVWVYALFTGAMAPVVRAAVMVTVYMLGRMMQRRSSGINSLCVASVVILAFDPDQLFTAGFQLSFSAVLTILVFSSHLSPWQSSSRRWLRATGSAVGVSLSANLGAGAVAAWHFHTFPVWFLLTNTVAGLLMPAVMGGGMLLIGAWSVGLPSGVLCVAVDALCSVLRMTVGAVASLPGAVCESLYFPGWVFVPYLVALAMIKLCCVSGHRGFRVMYAAGCAAALACIAAGVMTLQWRHYPDEWIISRNGHRSTDIVIRRGDDIKLFTTASVRDTTARLTDISDRYSEYARRRGVTRISLLTPTDTLADVWTDGYGNLEIGAWRLFVASGRPDRSRIRSSRRYDYMILGRDLRTDYSRLQGLSDPDTLIIMSELGPDSAPFRRLWRD